MSMTTILIHFKDWLYNSAPCAMCPVPCAPCGIVELITYTFFYWQACIKHFCGCKYFKSFIWHALLHILNLGINCEYRFLQTVFKIVYQLFWRKILLILNLFFDIRNVYSQRCAFSWEIMTVSLVRSFLRRRSFLRWRRIVRSRLMLYYESYNWKKYIGFHDYSNRHSNVVVFLHIMIIMYLYYTFLSKKNLVPSR